MLEGYTKISDFVSLKQSQLGSREKSEGGFDICYISFSGGTNKKYLGKNFISEKFAWQIARNMVRKNPYYFSMVYVVDNRNNPVKGYKRKAIII